jgi:hypothetical protein
MRLRGLCVLLVVVAGLVAAGLSSGADSVRKPRVTVFGDSVADAFEYVPDARAILGRGLEVRWALAPCRRLVGPGCPFQNVRPPGVLDIVQTEQALGKVVVVDVGYNDFSDQYAGNLDLVMRALARDGVQTVLWVTLRDIRGPYGQINDAIEAGERRWKQLQVVDWNAYGAGRPAWFKDDGLHLTAAGAMGLARLLRPYVLEAACPDGCNPRRP